MWTSNVVLDHGCKRYAMYEPYVRTHAQTKFSIECTSVRLAHARPINIIIQRRAYPIPYLTQVNII